MIKPVGISEVFVVVAEDNDTGAEGIVAELMDDTWYPMVATNPERMRDFIRIARRLSGATGKTHRLLRFTSREVLETFQGK